MTTKTIPDPAKSEQPQGNQSQSNGQPQDAAPAVAQLDALAAQVADLAKLIAGCVTLDALSAAHKRIDDLARHVDALRKGHDATTRVVSESLRDYTKVQPKSIHEAIQRLKAEGSTLVGTALRQAAGEKFLGWKPKPATASAPKAKA